MSRSKSGMGGSKSKSHSKPSGDKPHEIHIKRAHGGGFVVTHHKKKKHMMDGNEPEQHVVPDADQLAQHVSDNMGDQPAAGQGPAPEPQPQAAVPQGPPTQMGM